MGNLKNTTYNTANNNSKNNIGFLACVGIILGGCIGSAIFSLSGLTISYAGEAATASWIIAGLIMLVYGLVFCILAKTQPSTGGMFMFPLQAFGGDKSKAARMLGYICGICFVAVNIIAMAFSAIYVGVFLNCILPGAAAFQIVIAILCVFLCFWWAFLGLNKSGILNFILIAVLSIVLVVFCCNAFCCQEFCWNSFSDPSKFDINGMLTAIPIAALSYSACTSVCIMSGRVRGGAKTTTASLIVSMAIVIALYAAVIAALTGSLGSDFFVNATSTDAIMAPMFTALQTGAVPGGDILFAAIAIAGILALITTVCVMLVISADTVTEMAKIGFLPPVLSKQNKKGIPYAAMLALCICASILCCFPEMVNTLINVGALVSVVSILIILATTVRVVAKQSKHSAYKVCIFAVILLVGIALVACYVPTIISGYLGVFLFSLIVFVTALVIYGLTQLYLKKRNL